MRQIIDLNCDMGELLPGCVTNFDAEIMPYITSCNVACGFHSGNAALMMQTVKAALKCGVKVGAHPSYNDPKNFGRKRVEVSREVLIAELTYQIGAVKTMVESLGGQLHHVKPHGALYHDIAYDEELAKDVVQLLQTIDPDIELMVLANSSAVAVCETLGQPFLQEAFADRRYESEDKLRSRAHEDAVITDKSEVLEQVAHILSGKVELMNGSMVNLPADTICLHSDTKGAVTLSKDIFDYLKTLE